MASVSILLHVLVVVSLLYCVGALATMLFRTRAIGNPTLYSRAAGSTGAGIRYAFGQGMLPWEKESITKHPVTYAAGIAYHTGIAAAFVFMALQVLSLPLPSVVLRFSQAVLVLGLVSGLGLLLKRMLKRQMRFISIPDDYVSNILADGFVLLALLASIENSFYVLFLSWTVVLAFYIPLGKIRHCAYFFYTRVLFGRFFGRRGVLPHR